MVRSLDRIVSLLGRSSNSNTKHTPINIYIEIIISASAKKWYISTCGYCHLSYPSPKVNQLYPIYAIVYVGAA